MGRSMDSRENFELLEYVVDIFDINQIPPGLLLDALDVNQIHLSHSAKVATQGS